MTVHGLERVRVGLSPPYMQTRWSFGADGRALPTVHDNAAAEG
jgi:hypothetical protein